MTTELILPKPGMGIDEGTVSRWLKQTGESVRKGEPVVEIETAKAVQQVESPVDGVLVSILLMEGETAAVNTAIALIDEKSA